VVESSALLKRRAPKGHRGFESLPHRFTGMASDLAPELKVLTRPQKLKFFVSVAVELRRFIECREPLQRVFTTTEEAPQRIL
jgi:hypothetical protein